MIRKLLALLVLPLGLFAQENAAFYSDEGKAWADSVMNTFSLEDKLGQLFMVAAYSNLGNDHVQKISNLIEKENIGGVIFFQGGPVRQARLTNKYQKMAKVPLMIGMDAEWDLGMRLDSTFSFPWAMTIGAVQDSSLIYYTGRQMGKHCKRLGVHVNFAPVLDINTNPLNPIINARSFGQDKMSVTWHAGALSKGMQDENVMACGKHFPGHGDTDKDSHKTLPTVGFDSTRIWDVELYPYRKLFKQGLGSVMVAHLNVPALDASGTPTSLSPKTVTGMLKDQLGFDGLIFTDALNMKGVSSKYSPGVVDVKALLAGNDILLFPHDVAKAKQEIMAAVSKGEITQEEIDARIKKILVAKYWMGLNKTPHIETKGLYEDLNDDISRALRQRLMNEAATVLVNKDKIFPVEELTDKKFAVVTMGTDQGIYLHEALNKCADVDLFKLNGKNANDILNQLSVYDHVFVGWYTSNKNPWKSYKVADSDQLFVKKLALQSGFSMCIFANPYSLIEFEEAQLADGLIMAYQNNKESEYAVAQIIFGALEAKGRLPVNTTELFDAGYGLKTTYLSRLSYGTPEEVGIASARLDAIDSVANWAIADGATPGCQILVAKEGKIIYEKSFGYHTYKKKRKVKNSDLYDLASITKITATLPILMELYEEGKFNLDDELVTILPEVKGTNKEHLRIRDILAHQAGLTPWIPFYLHTLKDQRPDSRLYSSNSSAEFNKQVADDLYINGTYKDSMYQTIYESALGNPTYKYSDLGYYFFLKYVENERRVSIDKYVQERFYTPLGATTLGYLPLDRFNKERITPTEKDMYFRYQTIHGYVHDQGASMMGGVAGHAGLFSNANDLAKMMQMYLQGGFYGGKRYFRQETLDEFTRCQFCATENRRGAGFDKPQLSGPGPACDCVSMMSFGHTGFTGTISWVDPEEELVYIFLSNRINTNAENKKLIYSGVRTTIQEIIYNSLNTFQL